MASADVETPLVPAAELSITAAAAPVTASADTTAAQTDSAVVQQIASLKRELEQAQSQSPVDYHALLATLSRLQSLDQQLITAQVLQQTQIGVLVNRLTRAAPATSTASEEETAAVREAAKSIIAQWKDKVKAKAAPITSPPAVSKTIATSSSSSTSSPPLPLTPASAAASSAVKPSTATSAAKSATSTSYTASAAPKRKADANGSSNTLILKKSKPDTPLPTTSAVPSPPTPVRTSSTSSLSSSSAVSPPSTPGGAGGSGSDERFVLSATRDGTRNKIQQLLFEAIGGSAGAWETELAVRIERAIHAQHGDTGAGYKSKYRELAMNLKDSSNPDLNDALLCGAYTPEQVVSMSVKELASKQLKEQRQAEAKWAAQEARSDLGKLNGLTDMFRCGKCRERKCTYYQMQTRSADEPMTVFVRCTVCGNRWKM